MYQLGQDLVMSQPITNILARSVMPLQYTLKVASRCNLNCTYCYVYNKGDDSWKARPPIMSDEVMAQVGRRIRRHCVLSGQDEVEIVFHGGEPLLAGLSRVRSWCAGLRAGLSDLCRIGITVQTNGTLIDNSWAEFFAKDNIQVGISLDGPAVVNDQFRVTTRGRGSYNDVLRGIGYLRRHGIRLNFLTVINFGSDPLSIHRHLIDLGAASIAYLMPDHTHDTVALVRAQYGPTPCADYLLPILEEWWSKGYLELSVNPFVAFARAILGGNSRVDFIENRPFGYVFVEADGAIEGLDVLKICGAGLADTGLNVSNDDFKDISAVSELHRRSIFEGFALPDGCHGCPENTTCAGGYLPHRFSSKLGFNNPSVWCADLLRIFGEIRERLNVPVEETLARRQILADMANVSAEDD